MVNIDDKQNCIGCFACAQVCPQECIIRKKDSEGFDYPIVNADKCVKCGLCDKVCPIVNNKPRKNTVLTAYAAYAVDDEVRMASSSGGIFSLLAEEIIKDGGIVVGAGFDDQLQVLHIAVDNIENISKLRGSKYVQSEIGDTYIYTKQNLEIGRKVLFTGTACQIAGLKQFLRKEYENLYTMDVLCHGTPSPLLWKRYLAEKSIAMQCSIQEVYFRQKESGWKKYSVVLKNGNIVSTERFWENSFMRLFLSNICLRPSCHNCKFKALERDSDITLGDCWGIEKILPEMDDDKGTSVVLIHSEKGNRMFDNIKSRVCFKEENVNKLLPPTAESRKSVKPHPNRERFFSMLQNGDSIERICVCIKPNIFMIFKRKVKSVIRSIPVIHK